MVLGINSADCLCKVAATSFGEPMPARAPDQTPLYKGPKEFDSIVSIISCYYWEYALKKVFLAKKTDQYINACYPTRSDKQQIAELLWPKPAKIRL